MSALPGNDSVHPPAPRPGDTIGVIAPASSFDPRQLERGCEHLRRLGYKIFFHESIAERDLYFAGPAERRAWELEQMFEKRFVQGILCARGGYGSNYLLPLLKLEVIRKNPKFLMGYSDITALLTYIHDQTGLVTYHGPMVAKDFADAASPIDFTAPLNATVDGEHIKAGECSGKLYGGCLSILVASLGTPHEIQTMGTILFVEDVGTKPYQVDRMLRQLKLARKLDGVRGIVFGEMPDCAQPGGQDHTLQEVVQRVLSDFDGPIGWGLRSGHLSDYTVPGVTLPMGAAARLAVSKRSMTLQAVATGSPTAVR